MNIGDILIDAANRKVSDILISAGAPLTFHRNGVLEQPEPGRLLTANESEKLIYQLLKDDQRKEFETELELDLSFQLQDVARFRVSVLRQRGTIGGVLRVVPLHIPHYSEIGITDSLLTQLTNITNGMILITGPTGAGKSTSVAAFLEYLNTEYGVARHIITVEDPIEFLMTSKTCVIDQRELGPDTKSYVNGLRSALRQMPHVIFVGEMRDRETMEIALTAAETGNLVISTLATQSASKTVNRIIDVFPLEDQIEIRARLALSLRAVISQVLLRRTDEKGRIAAREIMFVSNSISNLIREGKIHQINNMISSSYGEGMVLLDDSLLELHSRGIVHTAEVAPRLQDPEKARVLMRAA